MDIRLVAYDRLGSRRGVVPDPLEQVINSARNDLSTLSLHYAVDAVNSELLEDEPELAVETFVNGAWVEIRNARLRLLTIDFDHLEEVPTRRYDFIGIGEVLKGVLVYGAYGLELNSEGHPQFKLATPGKILKTIWDNAVSRGWEGFNYSFSATADSDGKPWAHNFTISYSVDRNLLGILMGLVNQGVVDFCWEGRTLHVYNPGTYLARDLTVGPNPVRFAGSGQLGTDAAPEMQDQGNLATHVVVLGENNLRWEFPTGTVIPEGRREVVLTYSGVDDIGTAQLLAAPVIAKAQNYLKNTTRQFHLNDETTLEPFIDFAVGDWANVLRGTTFEKMRIYSLNLQKNDNGIQGYVTLGDKIDDLLEVMYARIQGLQGGVANEGGAPVVPKGRVPASPSGLAVASDVYVDKDGITQGVLSMNWAHSGKDTAGVPLTLGEFVVHYRRAGTTSWKRLVSTAAMSATASPITVYDENLDPITYELYVVAQSNAGLYSSPSNYTSVTMDVDTTPPPVPTTPTVTTWLRTVTIKTDGKGVSPTGVVVDMPPDYAYTKVWEATNGAMTGASVIGTIADGVQSLTVGPKTSDVALYYALSSVDNSGNESAKTPSVSTTPKSNVDAAEIIAHLDAAEVVLENVGAEAIKTGAILQDKLADNAVSQDKLQDQIISLAKLDTDVDAKIQKGIDDAYAADGKAAAAQSAADAANNAAAAAAEAAISNNAYSLNPSFDDWDSDNPMWFAAYGTGPEKSTAFVKRGNVSARFNCTDTTASRGLNFNGILNHADNLEYFTVEISFYFASGTTLSGVGVLLDWAGMTGNRAQINLKDEITNPQPGKWYTVVKTLRRPVGATGTFIGMDGYLMANYAGNGAPAIKDVYIDWLNIRPATNEEITSYGTPSELTRIQNLADDAQADATQAIQDASEALSAANSRNIITNSIVDASNNLPGKTDGDLWQKWTSLGYGGKLLKAWRWSGTAWITVEMDPTYLPLVDIGQGTFGFLDGMRLEADSVSTETLLVGDFTNLVDDPNVQGPGWEVSADDAPYVGSGPLSADGETLRGWRLTAGSTTIAVTNKNMFTVEPDTELYVEAKVSNRMDNPFYFRILWYDSAGVLAGSPVYSDLVFPVRASGDSGWSTLSRSMKPPAGARQAKLQYIIGSGATTGNVYIVRPIIRRKNGGNMYIDGSVNSNAVATNALTARTMFIGDFANLAIGSDFEDAAAVPWILHADHTITTSNKKSGTSSLRLGPGAAGNRISTFSGDTRVREDEQWYFSYWVLIDSSFNGDGNSKLRVGGTANAQLGSTTYSTVPRSIWTKQEMTVTIPAGTTSLTIGLWSTNTAGTAYIDDIQIRRVAEASLIQNLGVEKLVVNGGASMSTAVIDELWAKVVNSRKITTDMLNVGRGDNWVSWNVKGIPSSFAPHQALGGGVANLVTDSTHSGKTSLYVTGQTVQAPGTFTQFFRFSSGYTADNGAINHWNVTPKTKMVAEVYVRAGGTYPDAVPMVRWQIAFQNAGGTYIQSLYSDNVLIDFGADWDKVSFEFTVPDTAASMYVYLQQSQSGNVRIDDPFIAPQYQASLIAQGAIIAPHLTVTEEMWAKILHFKKLTGDEIDANSLTTDTAWIGVLRGGILVNDSVTTTVLKADAITSKHTITGAKVQTTTTANRGLKFTSAGLQMWDAAGKQTIDFNASTGYATVTGRVRTAPDGQPGAVLIPPVESDDGKTMALWLTPDTAQLIGQITAGVWMSNPATASDAGAINIRGQQYGGVNLFDEVELFSGDGVIPRISSHHGYGLQMTSYDGNLYLAASTGETRISSALNTFLNIATGKQLTLQSGGAAYNRTLSGTANAIIYTDGNVFKVSSASKYKIDPRPMELDDRLLDDVTVKDWIDVGMAERYAASLDVMGPMNVDDQREWDALSLERIPGTIAEDVEAAGGERFVVRDLNGEIDSLMYDRFALARTEILKKRYEALLERVQTLEDAMFPGV